MRNIDRDLDRILLRLRHAILERGYTQLEVQEILGWGRNYISQILTKKKKVRFEQLLMILKVIEVKPEDFFGEIFPFGEPTLARRKPMVSSLEVGEGTAALSVELHRLRLRCEALLSLLKKKGLIQSDDVERVVERARREP